MEGSSVSHVSLLPVQAYHDSGPRMLCANTVAGVYGTTQNSNTSSEYDAEKRTPANVTRNTSSVDGNCSIFATSGNAIRPSRTMPMTAVSRGMTTR